MDDLDRKILALLAKNARMPVKEIAEQVALTSPAVSSRIHKLETDGIIGGYTVTLNRPADRVYVDALISLSVAPSKHEAFLHLIQNSREVLQCYHVTGDYTFLIKVSCGSPLCWAAEEGTGTGAGLHRAYRGGLCRGLLPGATGVFSGAHHCQQQRQYR